MRCLCWDSTLGGIREVLGFMAAVVDGGLDTDRDGKVVPRRLARPCLGRAKDNKKKPPDI